MTSTAPARVNDEALFLRLQAGELVVLPTSRAARSLRSSFDAHQQNKGKDAWQAPRVMAWSSWTASLWSELIVRGAETRLLLNHAQEHSAWSELIAARSPDSTPEQNLPSLAQLAQSGFSLAAAFDCLGRLRGTALTHDHRTFAAWADAFQEHCTEDGLVASASLERALRQHLEDGDFAAPSSLLLLNWNDFTPAQARLLQAFEEHGTRVERLAMAPRVFAGSGVRSSLAELPTPFRRPRTLAIAPTERDELLCAALWIRSRVQAASKEPGRSAEFRVGVLLPGGPVPELESVFREILAPELQAVTEDVSATPWEFSRNEPLASVPLVAAALDLARFCLHPLGLDQVSRLLLSPYLGTEADREPNARFDAATLRRSVRLRPEISLAALSALISAAASRADFSVAAATPVPWLGRLNEFAGQVTDPKLRRTFSEWTEVLRRLLAVAGWPGSRSLSARENAAHRAWESTLDAVATLDFSGRRVPFRTAFSVVERQAREGMLDLPTSGAPISVVTLQEAEGCAFDALVLLRGSEGLWPPSRRPHPLLSMPLQKELRMPGTDPLRERNRLEALLECSGPVLATCAEAVAEGTVRPAPLFHTLGFEPVPAASLLARLDVPVPVREEEFTDDAPLPPLPSPEVRGGARVLQLQAACGFRAFAEKRLDAAEVETREAGFSPRDTGNLLHGALERFWGQVGSQRKLRAMSAESLHALLAECIANAVPRELQLDTPWDHQFLALQQERLRHLLYRWLSGCELSRVPFTVAALEQKQQVTIGPLQLRVRLDRMDRMEGNLPANAGLVLVDYKSGATVDPKTWFGDRPEEPQLPLYSLLQPPEAIKAITFAQIHTATQRYTGLESEPGLLGSKGAAPLAGDQIAQWRAVLTKLALDFSEGVSEVRPKDVKKTCKHCPVRLLCRIDTAAEDGGAEPDDAVRTGGVHG